MNNVTICGGPREEVALSRRGNHYLAAYLVSQSGDYTASVLGREEASKRAGRCKSIGRRRRMSMSVS